MGLDYRLQRAADSVGTAFSRPIFPSHHNFTPSHHTFTPTHHPPHLSPMHTQMHQTPLVIHCPFMQAPPHTLNLPLIHTHALNAALASSPRHAGLPPCDIHTHPYPLSAAASLFSCRHPPSYAHPCMYLTHPIYLTLTPNQCCPIAASCRLTTL